MKVLAIIFLILNNMTTMANEEELNKFASEICKVSTRIERLWLVDWNEPEDCQLWVLNDLQDSNISSIKETQTGVVFKAIEHSVSHFVSSDKVYKKVIMKFKY